MRAAHPIVLATTAALATAAAPQSPADVSADLAAARSALSELDATPVEVDWLVASVPRAAGVFRGSGEHEIALDNGLVRRTLRLSPDVATVGFDDLRTGAALLRAVGPEARVTLDGIDYAVGGLLGQPESGYLARPWLGEMSADPAAFNGTALRIGPIRERCAWQRVRGSEGRPWPPPGIELQLDFAAPPGRHAGVVVTVHYELCDGLPLLAKWFTLHNGAAVPVRVDAFASEILAAVEAESDVETPAVWRLPDLHVETDYCFGGARHESAERAVRWLPDPRQESQVNYLRRTPDLLVVGPTIGPGVVIPPGGEFESIRAWELVQDSTERERCGLAVRRMYRTIAPWCTENPILMHVRSAEPAAVRLAIDQAADVGFEMLILTFGSGFDFENDDPSYRAGIADLVRYARSKSIELGGYSLLASRRIADEHDVVDPATGKPDAAARFGHSPCLGSTWAERYFDRLRSFVVDTGLSVIEHDGSYPGDVCASTAHPGHAGLADSQWRQWQCIRDFYRWCRGRGVYLNVPDWYFLNGSNKCAMGYRESNWSLPRERQVVLGRQNIFDGTWTKTPSMGWMFVPLVEYQGGGAAATLEPLQEHLDAYGWHLANNFGAGVQACYRGPRLYDAPATRAVVTRWVDFYRAHRPILDSDVVHVRRADGRDLDALLHVNPFLDERALLVVYNPEVRPVARLLDVPLRYAGLRGSAIAAREGGTPAPVQLDRDDRLRLQVEVAAQAMTWYVFRAQ